MVDNGSNGSHHQVPDSVLDLIRKCLALSQSPNEFEAELAMAKAQELLLKHNLSMDQVKDAPKEDLAELIDCYADIGSDTWLRLLYNVIAEQNFCKVVGHHNNISILGRMVNVQATLEMAQWMQVQVERLCEEACQKDLKRYSSKLADGTYHFSVYNRESTRSFKQSFYLGIVSRIGERLRALRQESVNQSIDSTRVTALVVRLREEATSFMRKEYPLLVTSARPSITSSNGYQSGRRAGDRVGIIRPSQSLSSGNLRLGSGS